MAGGLKLIYDLLLYRSFRKSETVASQVKAQRDPGQLEPPD
jgi:hypothetical protein